MCQLDKIDVRKRRQHTAYVDDDRNWVIICDECNVENEKYWKEQWAEYYALVSGD